MLKSGRARHSLTSWTSSRGDSGSEKTFFGVGPLHLSEQLLSELSVRSVSSAQLPDDPRRWVDRYIDTSLKSSS